jgi:AcrR family transcriptional regulator
MTTPNAFMPDEAPYHHGNLRQALIDAALCQIRDSGVESVSLRGLARDLGVSHAAPARHFPTRAALFAAIAEQGFRGLAEHVVAARHPAADPLHNLRCMARAHVDWVCATPRLYAAMRNAEVLRHAGPDLLAVMQGFAEGQRAAVQAARATGWRAGEPAEVTFLSIVTGLAGIGSAVTDPFLAGLLGSGQDDARIGAMLDRLLAP